MLLHTQLFCICFAGLSLISPSIAGEAHQNANPTKPHIVIILADDLGFDDVSFRGSNEFLTPNIDALGYHGRILDRFYAAPVCTPSRAALLTGLYSVETETNILTHLNGLSPSLSQNFTLMPEVFKAAGYSTNLIGKWNLGHAHKEDTPTYRGFDHHFGHWGCYIDHFTRRSQMPFCNMSMGYDFRRDMAVDCGRLGEYVTELYTAEAEEIIEKHAEKPAGEPLFLLLAHAAPHSPLQAPAAEISKFAHIKNPARRTYAAMVSILDRSVGRVVRALERAELLEHSIIIFSSDNGGDAAESFAVGASNWPLRGQKDSPWEGGIRLAAAVWSPLLGTTRQREFKSPVFIGDWLPTLAAAASIELPKGLRPSGVNLWSALTTADEAPFERSVLHVHDPKRSVVAYMRGAWKYVNGTTNHGQFDGVLTLREHDELDPRAPRYVVEVRNSLASRALSKFDHQRLTQHRIESLRRGLRVQCGDLRRACNPLVEACLFNLEVDPCEQNNLVYEEEFGGTLAALRAEVAQLSSGSKNVDVTVPYYNCKLKDSSDPALHNCLWANYLDEPASGVRQQCSDHGAPCARK